MPSGLAALLDDIATITKVAAASIDDVAAAAGKASTKAQKARCKKIIWYLDSELVGILFFNKFNEIYVFV